MNQPEMLLINSVKKVKNTNQKTFEGQDANAQVSYYYSVNVCKVTNDKYQGKEIISAGGNTKILFANSNLHKNLFTMLDKICKDTPAAEKTSEAVAVSVDMLVYGYTINYIPTGKRIVRKVDLGNGQKEDREFANVTLVVLGERARSENGVLIEASGETPESIYKGMLRKELFREIDDNTSTYSTAEEDMLKKAAEDQSAKDALNTPPVTPP